MHIMKWLSNETYYITKQMKKTSKIYEHIFLIYDEVEIGPLCLLKLKSHVSYTTYNIYIRLHTIFTNGDIIKRISIFWYS